MRKLFRFKYEPCNGTCYAPFGIFFEELGKIGKEERENLVNTVVQAHDKLCDSPDYSFGIDKDEELGIFIGHFRQPDRTETFAGTNLKECILKTCNAVIDTDIPVQEGHCNFGEQGNENLTQKILEAVA